MLIVTRGNSISHSGIKGQKCGVRRFQNEDGSLTPEGRERYGVGDPIQKKTSRYEPIRYKVSVPSDEKVEKKESLLKRRARAMKKSVSSGAKATVKLFRNVPDLTLRTADEVFEITEARTITNELLARQ